MILHLLVAVMTGITAGAQTAHMLWSTKWDVNFFINRKTGFSSDSKYYAIADSKGQVTIYTADSGYVYTAYKVHDKQVFCSYFQPMSHIVASGDKNGILKLYDIDLKQTLMTLNTEQGALTALAFSKDGSLLATGGRGNSVKIWNPANGRLLTEISNITGNVICLRITPDNKTIIAGTRAMSKGLKVFDIKTGEEQFWLETSNLQNFDLSPDGDYIAMAELSKYLTVYNRRKRSLQFDISGLGKHLTDIAYEPTRRSIISSSEDHLVTRWDMDSLTVTDLVHGRKSISGIALAPNGTYMAVMDEDGTLSMWDVRK